MEFIEKIEAKQKIMADLIRKKNADYAGREDPYQNFRRVEALGICTTEQAIMVRMADKFARIANLLKKEAKVVDESMQDSLLDLANYATIFAVYLDDQKEKNSSKN